MSNEIEPPKKLKYENVRVSVEQIQKKERAWQTNKYKVEVWDLENDEKIYRSYYSDSRYADEVKSAVEDFKEQVKEHIGDVNFNEI